jgi:hypothetical protein
MAGCSTVDRYEGGLYSTKGVWRPSEHSMMKVLGYAYDQVARERMTQAIAQKVDLIQDSTPAGAPIGADRVVWLETMHPADDGPGTPLAELQVDGDGWFRYFGWPTDSTAPWLSRRPP